MSFTAIERLIDRYDTATSQLDTAVTDRISKSMDAAFRQMVQELERQYPTWASQGSLYASQRRLLLLQELGPLLAIVRPEDAAQYQALMQEALQLSHTTGATLADELVRVRDPGYPLQDFATIPIEAAVAQARDGVGRLYRYSDEFRTAASGIVEQGLIQGWGTKRVQGVLERELGVAKGKAETLARTEVMSALNTAATERYQANGIEQQQWITTPSDRLCPTCAARHGNVYKVGEATIPAHPRCRCIWLPFKSKWQQLGLTDDAAIADSRAAIAAEFERRGGRLDVGPTYWEKKAGLTAAPAPVWKPGDAVQRAAASAPAPAKPAFLISDISRRTLRAEDDPEYNPEIARLVSSSYFRQGREYGFTIKGGNSDGTDTVVLMDSIQVAAAKGKTKATYEVGFQVNGSYQATNVRPEASTLISNQISAFFREDIAASSEGTRYITSPAEGDTRGAFREAMYARMGYSFKGGATQPGKDGEQHGIVQDGRLVPTNAKYRAFSEQQLEAHKAAQRQALRDAIKQARNES